MRGFVSCSAALHVGLIGEAGTSVVGRGDIPCHVKEKGRGRVWDIPARAGFNTLRSSFLYSCLFLSELSFFWSLQVIGYIPYSIAG